MDIHKYLSSYKYADPNIAFYQSRIEYYRPLIGLTRKLNQLAAKQMTHYQEQIRKLKTLKKDIEQTVKEVPLPYRNALYCRYIEGLTINATAHKLHYAPTTIRRHLERGFEIIENNIIQKS